MFCFLDWWYDTWWFTADDSSVDSINILVSGWDVDIQEEDPVNMTYPFPVADSVGK